jgi:hypothetical protein
LIGHWSRIAAVDLGGLAASGHPGPEGGGGGGQLLLALEQQGQRLHQGRGRGVGGGAQQLNPLHPLLHKLRHRGWIAEVQLAGGAEHHHPPPLDTRLLLQQPGGFGVEPPQETAIGGHLGLQDQGRQLRPLWRG